VEQLGLLDVPHQGFKGAEDAALQVGGVNDFTRLFRAVPEAGRGGLDIQIVQLRAAGFDVKDTPASLRSVSSSSPAGNPNPRS
jgi:hypothetical protein